MRNGKKDLPSRSMGYESDELVQGNPSLFSLEPN
jgi:hypothetical protein